MKPEAPETESLALVDVPNARVLLGHLAEFRRRPLETLALWRQRYGDLVRFRLGPRTLYLLSHPDLAEEVLLQKPDQFVKIYDPSRPTGLALVLGNGLVTSTGEVWRTHRRIIQPIFQRSRIALMAKQMVGVGQHRLECWKRHDPREPVDIASEMMQLTLEVISQTMFSTSMLTEIERIAPAMQTCLRVAFSAFHNPLRPPLWVPTPSNLKFRRAKVMMDRLVYSLITERRRSGERRDDLLDVLLHARDAETGTGLSDEQLRDEMLTIFAAGHETTANALSWTWYLLGTHPDARRRLQDELAAVLDGHPPTADDLARLPYTRAVFEEALRLYPPAPVVQRKAAVNTSLAGHHFSAGSLLLVSIYNIHRHPDFWEEPDRFKPERFLQEDGKPLHRLSYLPFGSGPRACVGASFALVEGPLLLALIAQQYDLEPVPGDPVELDLAVTLRPRYGLRMRLHPRLQQPRGR